MAKKKTKRRATKKVEAKKPEIDFEAAKLKAYRRFKEAVLLYTCLYNAKSSKLYNRWCAGSIDMIRAATRQLNSELAVISDLEPPVTPTITVGSYFSDCYGAAVRFS